jgi:hypothetical protein
MEGLFGFVASIDKRVTLCSSNGLIANDNYQPMAKALEKIGPPAGPGNAVNSFALRISDCRSVTLTHTGSG